MIEKISLRLCNESGASIEIEASELSMQSKLDVAIADTFSAIIFAQNDITDAEIRTDEKFRLCVNLQNYLEEMKDASHTTAD